MKQIDVFAQYAHRKKSLAFPGEYGILRREKLQAGDLMDYNTVLDLATDVGYELAMAGAETFRVEDSVHRILESFGLNADVFAIPNYLVVSIVTDSGKPITRMRRIGFHSNDLDAVERLNGLSRAICERHPGSGEAADWLKQVQATARTYSFSFTMLGYFAGAAGFGMLFGCDLADTLCAGLCGILIGLTQKGMSWLKVNPFFSTLASAFLMAFAAYSMVNLGLADHADSIVIGALMILVPGLLFTNAMRDIIYGDTNSGINRIVQVFLIAVAIALGTAAGWNFICRFWREPADAVAYMAPFPVLCLATMVGCIGFSIQFNIHGPGGLLCALGGVIAWAVYYLCVRYGLTELTGYFWAAFFSAVYSEIMARVRKYPAISYLLVSIFPLIPGAGVYRTMLHAVRGEMEQFASQGMFTAAIAGIMAVGILLVSTSVKMYYTWRHMKK